MNICFGGIEGKISYYGGRSSAFKMCCRNIYRIHPMIQRVGTPGFKYPGDFDMSKHANYDSTS
jgi:hypothetical protein